MRSFCRDLKCHLAAARPDLTLVWLMLLGFAVGGCSAARGAGRGEAQARAALALAKAKRDRQAASCFTDYAAAVAETRKTNRPLVLWVGMTCSEHPQLRAGLADAVHCHLPERGRDGAPRVVIQGADGVEWFVRAEKIGPATARQIRAKWQARPTPPLRPDVGIGEELAP